MSGHVAEQIGVVMVVELLPGVPSPPPDTDAVLTAVVPLEGNTVTVMGLGLVAPALITVPLVQLTASVVEALQFQPVPLGVPTMVRLAGIVSVTVIVPLEFAAPSVLFTVSV